LVSLIYFKKEGIIREGKGGPRGMRASCCAAGSQGVAAGLETPPPQP